MYTKSLFHKVLNLVDDDIAQQFRSIPGEPLGDEKNFPTWDIHDPMIMQILRDLKKIAHTIESGVTFEKSRNRDNGTDNGRNG